MDVDRYLKLVSGFLKTLDDSDEHLTERYCTERDIATGCIGVFSFWLNENLNEDIFAKSDFLNEGVFLLLFDDHDRDEYLWTVREDSEFALDKLGKWLFGSDDYLTAQRALQNMPRT